ncbi:hypothetical protein AB0I81_58450 [Nonomuraea sp. NPDC050404]|uniref:hypothetical protein n=1 Tax=Nonomuraea sp. NPDC050404 TaxID=3155783 RepID=UPI003405A112
MSKILTIGIDPATVDFTDYPGQNAATLTARIEQSNATLRAEGLDTVILLVGPDPDAAESTLREQLSRARFDLVMIGAGIRTSTEHTMLFERLVNVLITELPGVRLCFNTSPDTTIDAIRRLL